MLVDDDADDQLIFLDALSEVDDTVECATASNGLEALSYLHAGDWLPAVIFIDLNMPLMNGFELLGKIKKDPRMKDIPIVIFTTSDSPLDLKRAEKAGAQVFFTKTSDFKTLKIKIQEILGFDFSIKRPFDKAIQ